MTNNERLAQKAFEFMVRLTTDRAGVEMNRTHEWSEQSAELKSDWIAVISAVVAEEREACAEIAEGDLDATDRRVQSEIAARIRSRGEE